MKLAVIGSGYVGLVTGTCFAEMGNQVICVDKDESKLSLLRKGKAPIYEPGLDVLIKKNMKARRLRFSSSIAEAVLFAEVIFISVNTPPKPNGEADLSAIENVSVAIARNLKSYRLIVEKSTVPVQTGQRIYDAIRRQKVKESLFDVASNPEFLREGSAVKDFLNPDRIVVGVQSKKAENILRSLYAPFKSPLFVTNLASSELIKHASNSFLATKISFVNMLARICEKAGADVDQVTQGMGMDPRIGASFLKAGIGFGGFCFPKDLQAFLHMSEVLGCRFNMLEESLKINESQKEYFVQKVESVLWNLKDKRLAVWGLAFKPNTDDMRFAPSEDIIRRLQMEGATISAYDPEAAENAKKILKQVRFAKDPYDTVKKADALLILTEWDEFKSVDWKRVKKLMAQSIVIDGRNMFQKKEMTQYGFDYYEIGKN